MNKEKLKVGTWYKFRPYQNTKTDVWYLKYLKGETTASEYIKQVDGKITYVKEQANFSNEYWEGKNTYIQADISEFSERLPDNHLDKAPKEVSFSIF